MTGAPLLIHPGRDETAPLEIIDILDRAGADLSHTIMGHLDRTVFERGTLKQIAESGCYMEWDLFGWVGSYYAANPNIDMPSDDQRLERIAWISSEGYGRKVVVAHDICTKHRLEKYGGHGYSYILDHIAPRMLIPRLHSRGRPRHPGHQPCRSAHVPVACAAHSWHSGQTGRPDPIEQLIPIRFKQATNYDARRGGFQTHLVPSFGDPQPGLGHWRIMTTRCENAGNLVVRRGPRRV